MYQWVRCGLSPRVRGNPKDKGFPIYCGRSIPACAGEPEPQHSEREPIRVYPRVCGGTASASARASSDPGLSPRVRGNRASVSRIALVTRSIPACAGEPIALPSHRHTPPVYPRVCGGTGEGIHIQWRDYGLSPRVRGNHCSGIPGSTCCRSIPACAGEPQTRLHLLLRQAVYPRVCGGTVMDSGDVMP